MRTTEKTTALVVPGVGAPGEDRCEPSTTAKQKKGFTPMKAQFPETDENGYFTGDGYQRLRKGAEVLAADENLVAAEPPYNSEGLLAFADSIAQLRLLEGLSEYDCNTIALIVNLDFLQGPRRMAWRIYDMLTDEPQTPERDHDNEIAVTYAMVSILRMVIGAWLEPDPERNLTAIHADLEEASGVIDYVANKSGDAARLREATESLLLARDAVADAIEVVHECR